MAKELLIGKTNNTAKKPSKILVGNSSNIAKEVKSIFVGNSSNQAVKVFPSFPDLYQKCEYILNSNTTEYINTGVTPNSDTTVYLEYELVNDTIGVIFGATVGNNNSDIYGANITSNNPRIMYGAFNSPVGLFEIGIASINTRFRLDFNKQGGYFYLNGDEVYSSISTFANTANKGITLFGINAYQMEISPTKIRVYHFQAWQSNRTMLRDMYPCYLKSDTQVVGMYDLVEGQFYGNSGTGIFYKGPDVN